MRQPGPDGRRDPVGGILRGGDVVVRGRSILGPARGGQRKVNVRVGGPTTAVGGGKQRAERAQAEGLRGGEVRDRADVHQDAGGRAYFAEAEDEISLRIIVARGIRNRRRGHGKHDQHSQEEERLEYDWGGETGGKCSFHGKNGLKLWRLRVLRRQRGYTRHAL